MAQAHRSDFDVSSELLFARRRSGRLAVATGAEAPVVSPALEMQKALDEMFTAIPPRQTNLARSLALTTAAVATVGVCSAFWWETLHWAASLIA
jgi:hypothetical protein